MILRNGIKRDGKDAAAKVSVAMMLVTIGLMLIVVGVVGPTPSSLSSHTGLIPYDFLRGFLFGFAIVLEIAGVVTAASAARVARKD